MSQPPHAHEARPGVGQPSQEAGAAQVERWLDVHGDVLWRFALSRTGSVDLAEDVAQETLLAAIEAIRRGVSVESERTWLLGIAAHKVADHFRRSQKQLHALPDEGEPPCECERCRAQFTRGGKWARVPAMWPELGDGAADRATALEALRRCLEGLSPGHRETVVMRDLLELPVDEVCKILELTATNVWTRLHRARAALRTCVDAAMSAPGDRQR